ncbi:secondary thiamine-phosphate synthase enzyme YjbQ [Luteitalea sp.]
MHTLARTPPSSPFDPATVTAVPGRDDDGRHLRLRIETRRVAEVVDLTASLESFLLLSGVRYGVLAIHTLHTTTAIVVNEQEPLLHGDLFRQLDRLAPPTLAYDHDDPTRRVVNRTEAERTNGHAHCQAMLLGSSASVPVVGGRLMLGRWQRVLFVELDGPQERQVCAALISSGRG